MKMNGKIWFVFGLMMVMLGMSSIAVAAFGSEETVPRGMIGIKVAGETADYVTLEVGVVYVEEFTSTDGKSAEEINKEIETTCGGDLACIADEYEKRSISADSRVEFDSTNAVFTVDYLNPVSNTWTVVPGCDNIATDNTDEDGIDYYTTKKPYHYATCEVDKSLYEGVKITVRANLVSSDVPVDAPSQTIELGGAKAAPANIFSSVLSNLVGGLTAAAPGMITCPPGEVCPFYTLPCLGVFIIVGLLLASMYFSGKSPITLLDITTPRLPAPKGVAAGGQVMLPYGYGEMKKGINRKMGAAISALALSRKAMQGKMGYNPELEKAKKDISKLMKSEKAKGPVIGGGKQAEEMLESIATAGIRAGLSAKDMKALMSSLPYRYGDAEHKVLADILGRLKAKGGKDALMGDTIKDYMLSMRTMQTMDALSGHPDATTRSMVHQKMQTAIGKLGGTNRYPLLGVAAGGSFDSGVRSFGVVKTGTKAMIEHAPDMARAVARTTMEMVGGARAMERLEKKKPGAAAWLKKPSKAVELGQMFPVGDKMEHLYNTMMAEAEKDQAKYVLKQLYKKMGVNFAITEEQLVEMGYTDMNILEISGYNKNKGAIEALEKEIQEKVFSKGLTGAAMRDALLEIAEKHGAVIDDNMMKFSNRLAEIDASTAPGYSKFLELQEVLAQHEKATKAYEATETDKFYSLVGRSSVSDMWSTFVLRSLIHDADNKKLVGGGLKEELQVAWLRTVNRMTSLKPTSNMEELPSYMRDPAELAKLEKRINSTLGELLTDEGKANLKKFTGKTVENATIDDHMKVLYGGKSMAPGDMTEVDKEGHVAIWGDAREMGALEKNYKVYTDELWLNHLDTKENIAIGMWTESRFKRSYIDPYDATVEATLDRKPGSGKWSIAERTEEAKKEWTKKIIKEDMEQRFNSHFSLNAYGKGPETAAFYSGVAAGFLEKAMIEKGLPENHPDVVLARTVDVSNPSQLRKLNKVITKYSGEFEEVMKRPVTYDDIYTSKQAMVMLYEGGFAFAHKGMPLSSSDRVYGTVTIRDQNGRRKEFAPEEVVIDFPGREDLKMAFYEARDTKDPKKWSAFMDAAEKWKSGAPSHEKEKVFSALVWEYGQNTYDYNKYYAKTSLEISPKREAIPLAPDALRMFGIEGGKLREAIKPFRDLTHDLGNYIGKVALAAGGPVFRGSYDVTPTSSYLRMHSWRLAQDIHTKNYPDLTVAEREAYKRVGVAHFEYHQEWQWAIDRNPLRHSTSHGLQQATESYFQYGPRSTFDAQDYIRGTMTKSQWSVFRYGPYGAVTDLASKLHRIPTAMFGGAQMSMQGYPSRWDLTGNPLKPWDYTPTRMGEGVRALNPFSFDWAKQGIGKAIGKSNVWEGSLQRRQLTGPDIAGGLTVAPQDVYLKRVGTMTVARLGDANPGEAYITYGMKTKQDPAMAEWMLRNKDAFYMYDKNVKEQALSNTTRRTVAAEALGMRRSQELRQFGLLQNSLMGWANPMLFLWHMPLPFIPPQWSPKEQLMKAAQKVKYGSGRRLDAWVKDEYRSKKDAALKFAQPWKGAMVSYCRRCGRSGYKGSRCICGGMIYGA